MTNAGSGAAISKGSLWTGRVISILVVLFLVLDGAMKVLRVPHVMEVSMKLGYSAGAVVGIGAVLLACTALYALPQTAILGAILLTGYLGGAVATNLMAKSPAFNLCFAIAFGVLAWGGLFLRHAELRGLIPVRRAPR